MMWIAQGMISYENIGEKDDTLMGIADLYLSELASRSIVQVEIRPDYDVGNSKKFGTCKLHDVVRELCLKLGKREDFGVLSLEYQGGKFSSLLRDASSHIKIRHLAIDFRSEVEHEPTVACGEDTWGHIRSVRLFNRIGLYVEFPPQSIVDFQKFKLVRDLFFFRFKFEGGKLPRGITKLVHLRCLSLHRCELDKLPSSMSNLVYMETLDLHGSMNVEVPNVFKEMLRLKHLFLPIYGDENIRNYRLRLDEGVYELETLAFFDSRCHELKCTDRMKNLRYFIARVYDNESLSAIMNGIMNWNKIQDCQVTIRGSCDLTSERMLKKALTCPNLYYLSIWLKLGKTLAKCDSDLLSSKLKFLNLFYCEIEDDPMGILGKLPCLIILGLYQRSFVGEEMTCPANSFPRLKRLVLRGLPKLREWRLELGAMPLLSRLTIADCSCMDMIPEGLSVISTLQTLVIKQMPKFGERVSPSGHDFHKVSHVPSIIIQE
ncbi:putative disease resistance protein At1g59780 [Salvia hispanica]|uniref:putative disease resistance protein At1g59780 n=1 Tax=Salvia hispanica TaxID=49212 RepID=UPI00200939FB|nr:putative disease resistance protein At1g59780 [Salvia hispanica]